MALICSSLVIAIVLAMITNLVIRNLEPVLSEFNALGYDCRWTIVSAAELGACHLRERWWFIAHRDCGQLRLQSEHVCGRETSNEFTKNGIQWKDTDAYGARFQRTWWKSELARPAIFNGWKSKPTVCRGDNGVRHRVDRIRSLGNAVVPIQAREAFMRLTGLNLERK